ncbi:MAG: YecA family protein [Sphingomicrobium sp.]
MTKIGRNEACPCGSGKKYKKCHGAHVASQVPLSALRAINEVIRRRQDWENQFGAVEPPQTAKIGDQRVMIIDGKLKAFSAAYTFHDFLMNFIVQRLGASWFQTETEKPFESRHPIAQWHEKARKFHERHAPSAASVYSVIIEGVVGHFLTLAHDLYTLQHVGILEKRLVERLLHKDQFQGARYELQVAAVCLRAGFEVELEDETDINCKHCEFSIQFPATGRRFSVEVKSRHRRGVLGRPGKVPTADKLRPDVGPLIEAALAKSAINQRIVFIDLNLPPVCGALLEGQLLDQVTLVIEELEAKQNESFKFPSAILAFTNRPDHYVADDAQGPPNVFLMTGLNMPEFRASKLGSDGFVPGIRMKWPEVIALHRALAHQTSVPDKFDWREDS